MVYFYLKDVLKPIGGKVVHGRKNVLIKTIIEKNYSTVWTSNSMIFHFNSTNELIVNSGLDSIVIVTSNPEMIRSLESNVSVVKVKNVSRAYWKFINHSRRKSKVPFVLLLVNQIRSSLKEMVDWLLYDRLTFNRLKKMNGLGNLINLLFKKKDKIATIIETPFGEINETYQLYRPLFTVLTDFSTDHKNELSTYLLNLEQHENVIINLDIDEFVQWVKLKNNMITFGQKENVDFCIKDLTYGTNQMTFTLSHNDKSHSFLIRGYGKDLVYEATAAIILAYKLGMKLEDISRKLQNFLPEEKNITLFKGINGSLMLKDSTGLDQFNFHNSLDVLNNIDKDKQKIAVVKESILYNVENIEIDDKLDLIIIVGGVTKFFRDKIEERFSGKIIYCINNSEALGVLHRNLNPKTVFLIHSSMRMLCKKLASKKN
ncbi:hypothetical protein [Bacillus suaedaesalsae]|uniref:Mur ligase central domain-containing protein n=1 Tax=Bacillus suaedaesalsae TaxID=2810349 RepID=A0ABS2DIJ7_9BACI|nr:hypothetical protein [Bacillus suaedaesalsae]MBM6618211.1 hypothetical protein [Bacillus suaedaesalsae]